MTLKRSEWDPSEYLDNEESIQAYLNAAFETGDPQLIASVIGDVARARGMTQIARDTGFAREALYRALSEKGNPELATIIEVLKSLNMTVRVEPIEQKFKKQVVSGQLENYIYHTVIVSEDIVGNLSGNTISITTLSQEKDLGVFYEQQGSFVRVAGPISSTRIRSKMPRTSPASAGSSLEYAGGPARDGKKLGRVRHSRDRQV